MKNIMPDYDYYPTVNKFDNRGVYPIKAFVIHIGEGSLSSLKNTILNPNTQVSYNFILGVNGKVLKFVDTSEVAWHAGTIYNPTCKPFWTTRNPNWYTIGIAFEGFANDVKTFSQYLNLCRIIAHVANIYKIKINSKTIVYHREINSRKVCPGKMVSKSLLILFIKFLGVFERIRS